MNTNTAIMDRISRLLEMAERGGSEQERMLAAKKAQKLMLEHQISELSLSTDGPGYETYEELLDGMANHWQVNLTYTIAMAVGVHCHRDTPRLNGRRQHKVRKVVMVGRPDQVEFVLALKNSQVPFLERECELALQRTLVDYPATKARAFRTSFFYAAINRIYARLKDQRREVEQDLGTGMELVRQDEQKLKRYVEDQHGKMRTSRSTTQHDSNGQASGRAAGDRANTRPGRSLSLGQRQLSA